MCYRGGGADLTPFFYFLVRRGTAAATIRDGTRYSPSGHLFVLVILSLWLLTPSIMRLTLRTLLAYLDDVLDPVDKEELAQKIESSDFAEDLVHRTRDTVRRLRLSAPQLIGTGMGLDPNTVAEYLDNVMPPEQVGDFERICLESDVHLAEATACHHVLTMVLGRASRCRPDSRGSGCTRSRRE